jgi:hypothetical protein
VRIDLGGVEPVTVSYRGRARRLLPGTQTTFRLVPPPGRRAGAA